MCSIYVTAGPPLLARHRWCPLRRLSTLAPSKATGAGHSGRRIGIMLGTGSYVSPDALFAIEHVMQARRLFIYSCLIIATILVPTLRQDFSTQQQT